jgi:hypothetical protein
VTAGLPGVFYNEGGDADVMARTENNFGFTSFGRSTFQDTNDDGLPDARSPQLGDLPLLGFLFQAQQKAANPERLMVYQGAMTVEVARTDEAVASFLAQVKQWGGYLGAQQDQKLTVRLPSSQFDAAMAALRGMGRVLAESRQADDVTKQYADLGIRLDNAKKGRDRLLQLLEKAQKVEDMLAIEKELRRLTEEIERMEGELKYLADQVAMATLQVEFKSVAAADPQQRRPQPSRFPWINQVGVQAVREDF